MDLFARFPDLPDGIHLPPEQFSQIFLGKLLSGLLVFIIGLCAVLPAVGSANFHLLFARFSLVQDLGVNVQDAVGGGEFFNPNLPVRQSVMDSRRCFGSIGHRNHDRWGPKTRLFPLLHGFSQSLPSR